MKCRNCAVLRVAAIKDWQAATAAKQPKDQRAVFMTTRGHCLCGRTSWEFDGPVTWACYCHCDDCRRNCAAPVVAWLGVPISRFRWTGNAPATYESSPGVRRQFCATCGSPIAFEADHYAGSMHLYAASMEDPTAFRPEFHVNHVSKMPWLALEDGLPTFNGTLLHSPHDPQGHDKA